MKTTPAAANTLRFMLKMLAKDNFGRKTSIESVSTIQTGRDDGSVVKSGTIVYGWRPGREH